MLPVAPATESSASTSGTPAANVVDSVRAYRAIADFYEEEVDNAVDSMSSLLEPLIMAILGVLVGGLVIAMYLPIFKLGQVV